MVHLSEVLSEMTVVAGTDQPHGFLAWVQRSNLCSYHGGRQQLLLTPAETAPPDGVVLLHIFAWLLGACAHGWRDSLALTSNICRVIHSSVDVK